MLIHAEPLAGFARAILAATGSPDDETRIVADHLVAANLTGHDSHGVGMIPAYIRNVRAGLLVPGRHARIQANGAFGIVDGQDGYGQVIAREATEWAIERARRDGIAIIALRRTHHIGRVGSYGEQAVRAGLASVHFVNGNGGNGLVAPFGGIEARFSTNPVCIAIPADPPVILDFATSKIAVGKMRVAMNQGVPVAEGIAIDADGRPTTDPGVMFREPRGVMLPFGEHKGYGLALACELLAGAIGGAGTIQPGNPRDRGVVNGMLSFVFDPARLGDGSWIAAEAAAMIDYVRSAAPADPDHPVLVAGDPERQARAERLANGIPVDPTTWAQLVEVARSAGVEPPSA